MRSESSMALAGRPLGILIGMVPIMANGWPARRTVPARFALQDTDASVAAHDPPPTPAQPAESYGRMCGGLMRPSHMTPITPRTRHTTHDIPRTTRRLDFPQTAPIVDKAAARQADAGWSSSVARWAHNPEVHGSNPCPATTWPPFSESSETAVLFIPNSSAVVRFGLSNVETSVCRKSAAA